MGMRLVSIIWAEETVKTFSSFGAAAGTLLGPADIARAQLLITGNDEKVWFDETGKTWRSSKSTGHPASMRGGTP